jgi:hypothetical protein
MSSRKDIEAEFGRKILLRGALSLLQPQDALRLVARCREVGLEIWGLDAFLVSPQHVQPSMEHSIDFTSEREAGFGGNSWDRAETFLRRHEEGPYLFEVAIERDT